MRFIVLATVFWATSFPVITHGLQYISPYLFGFLRFAVAFAIFYIFLLIRKVPIRFEQLILDRRLALLGILNGAGYIFQFQAQALTTASKTALFINTSPIFVALIERFLLKRRLHPAKVWALVLVITGIFLISTNLNLSELSRINPGDLLNIGAALVWAVFVVESRGVVEEFGESRFNLSLYLWASIILFPLIFFEKIRFHPAGTPHVLHLALFCTIIAYMLYSRAVRTVSPTTIAITFSLEVVLATIISFAWLGERFTPVETIGALFVLSGITLAGISEVRNGNSLSE